MALVFNIWKASINERNFLTGTVKFLLLKSSWTPDADVATVAGLVADELAGGTYVRKTAAGKTRTVDNALDRADYKADNPAWTGLTALTAPVVGWVVAYFEVTVDADSIPIAAIALAANVNVPASGAGVDLTVKLDNQASNGRIFSGT